MKLELFPCKVKHFNKPLMELRQIAVSEDCEILDPWADPEHPMAYCESLAEELWQQSGGNLSAFVSGTDLAGLTEVPIYEETVQLSKVHVYKYKELLKETATVRLYGDRITVDDQEFPFETLGAVVVLGKNKLNLYAGNDVLQLKGDKRFNALKYVNFFHKYKNNKSGDTNGTFLGL